MGAKPVYSSRERILCTLSHNEPDRVPLWNLWRKEDLPFSFRDEYQRVEATLKMGLDDSVLLKPPGPREDDLVLHSWIYPVKMRVYCEARSFEHRYPVLAKEYLTPEGILRHSVKLTDDWPFGNNAPLLSDFNVSRSEEYLIKKQEDLKKLKYVLKDPTKNQIQRYRNLAKGLRNFARRKGVLLEGGWITAVDTAVWLFGFEPLVWKAVDDPNFVKELLAIVSQWEKPRLELLLEEKVDLVVHSGWYEMPYMWSPRLFRHFIKPIISEEVALTHSAGIPYCYVLTAGTSLIVEDLLDLGIDVLRGVDPIQGKDDLTLIKEKIGDQITIWGGINAAITLGRGTPNEIREAVDTAIQVLAPGGGFVLYPVDQIYNDTPWDNVQILIDHWKDVGRYPLNIQA